jgi:hypothetical protein
LIVSPTNPRPYSHWSHRVKEGNVFGYSDTEIDYINAARCPSEAKEREIDIMDKRIRNEEVRIREAPHLSGSEDEFGVKQLNEMKQDSNKVCAIRASRTDT